MIKDIVAIANSGGGVIIMGLTSRGILSRQDVTHVLELNPATFTDKIARYTGAQFDGTEIMECAKGKHTLAALVIAQAARPLVFERPGTYDIGGGRQKTAFAKGTVGREVSDLAYRVGQGFPSWPCDTACCAVLRFLPEPRPETRTVCHAIRSTSRAI